MKIQKCALCDNDNSTLLYKANFSLKNLNRQIFSARRIPDKIHYRIVKCNTCSLVYSNPILDAKEIVKLYQRSNYTYQDYEDDLIKTYGFYLNKFRYLLPRHPKMLEIGCGNGFFLRFAKAQGLKVWGVEPGVQTVRKAHQDIRKKIIIDVFKANQFKPATFDVICLFQVLDHIANPNDFLATCRNILKKNGLVICINHDVSSFSARILGESSPIFDIEHTYLYSKKTLAAIFKKNGYQVKEVFSVKNTYPLAYWLRMFPLQYYIKKIIHSLLSALNLSDTRLSLEAGNIGILAQADK